MSGLVYGFTNGLAYTCARTLSTFYGCDALSTGLVLLSYGVGKWFLRVYVMMLHISFLPTGSTCGSIFGGRWSDRTLTRLKSQHEQIHAEVQPPLYLLIRFVSRRQP